MGSNVIVDLLYVEWGDRHRGTSLHEALRCVRMAGGKIDRLVIVDNKLECAPFASSQASQTLIIPGDNHAREFSGWDAAYAAIGRGGPANVLLFVNDTFSAHRRARLSRRIRIASWLRTVAKSPHPEMFGAMDPFGAKPTPWAFGTLSQYISSYLFGMNPQAAERLLPLCQIDKQLDDLLTTEFSEKGLFTDRLPQAYADRINGWLLTPGKWRNATSLTAENFKFFRLKAKSVLYEYALTSRATEVGILVSDLFTGRNRMDRLVGSLAKWWMEHATVNRYPWLKVVTESRLLRP